MLVPGVISTSDACSKFVQNNTKPKIKTETANIAQKFYNTRVCKSVSKGVIVVLFFFRHPRKKQVSRVSRSSLNLPW